MSEISQSNTPGRAPSPDQQLMFPHEHLPTLQAVNRRAISPISLALQEVRLGFQWGRNLVTRRRTGEKAQVQRKLYEIFNGKAGAEVLQDKFLFGNLVRELGYRAPQSVLVSSATQGEELIDQVTALNTDEAKRFCKPLGGTKGDGTYVAESPEDALVFVQGQNQEYLIQTFESERQDWRYILHRDNTQLTSQESPRWRIGYERVRPKVIGDGHSPIGELVERNESMPAYAKGKYFTYQEKNTRSNMHSVPTEGELVEICDSANLAKGAYIRMPEEHELSSIDRFMLRFHQDLENSVGSPINTLAVDIGVKDPAVLDEPYDFERMRENIVFYEFQVPFGYDAYVDLVEGAEKSNTLSHLLPKTLQTRTRRQGVWYSFLKSLLVTGAITQRTNSNSNNV